MPVSKHLKAANRSANLSQTQVVFGWLGRGLLLSLLLIACACQQQSQPEPKAQQDAATSSKLDTRLSLNNATLEHSNAQGQSLWKIRAQKAVYSKDQKTAELEKLTGNIFENGKIILRIKAQRGEIKKNGQEIFLKDNIIATDPRNGAVMRSDEVEWHPQEGLLMVRKNLTGSHENLDVSAKEGRYYSRKEHLELIGNIVATTKDPPLQLKTDHLFWQIPQEKVTGDRPIQIVRFKDQTITDQVVANRSEVDLKVNEAKLRRDVEFKSLDPPVQIATNLVVWDYKNRIVSSDQPVQLVHYRDQITITGNQAQVNLEQEIAHVKGKAKGFSSRNQAKLYSDELIWNIPTQIVEALGNVIYEQTDPKFNLTGEKAVGKLQNKSVVVSGNSGDRVVTEIFP